METSVLFTLFADQQLPPHTAGALSRSRVARALGAQGGSASVEVPCSFVKVATQYLGPTLVAAALWQLREDGAIEIDRRPLPEPKLVGALGGLAKIGDVAGRFSLTGALARTMPRPAPDPRKSAIPRWVSWAGENTITIVPADPQERDPGLERTLLEMVRAEGRTTPEDLASALKLATWDGPTKRSTRFPSDPVKAGGGAVGVCVEAAIEAGLLTGAGGGAEGAVIDMAGWQVTPDCERIMALRPEFDRAHRAWEGFRTADPDFARDLVEVVFTTWAPEPGDGGGS